MHESLASFLLNDQPLPSVEVLRSARLAAYAYTTLPADHPHRTTLQSDYLAAFVRHQDVKQTIAPLLAAWQRNGIAVYLLKGFALNEFMYETPGVRFHGDVDVMIRPHHIDEALNIARSLQWRHTGRTEYHHNICALLSPDTRARIDLHRSIVMGVWPAQRTARRLAEALWDGAEQRTLHHPNVGDIPVQISSAVDAWLILAVQRCWSADGWRLKASDTLDVRTFLRLGVSTEQLRQRARDVGCARTIEQFLARCNPAGRHVDFTIPSAEEFRRWEREIFRERRTTRRMTLWTERVRQLPRAATTVPAAIARLWKILRMYQRERDVQAVAARVTPSRTIACPADTFSITRRSAAVSTVRWAMRIVERLCRDVNEAHTVQTLGIYSALREQGWPAVFVAGTEPVSGQRHTWVEVDGHPLIELDEHWNRKKYRVEFAYAG